ncbi:MAG: potassium-transporting ATPase subunit KdpA [Caulobacteraceae bacterium]
MDVRGWGEIVFTIALTVILAWPLGLYLARVLEGREHLARSGLKPVEWVLYRTFGVDPKKQQGWIAYTMAMLAFSAASFVVLYLILRFQNLLPMNPQGVPRPDPRTCRSTRRSASSPTPTGSPTSLRRRCRPSPRWPA